jgi:hypothetical protein
VGDRIVGLYLVLRYPHIRSTRPCSAPSNDINAKLSLLEGWCRMRDCLRLVVVIPYPLRLTLRRVPSHDTTLLPSFCQDGGREVVYTTV